MMKNKKKAKVLIQGADNLDDNGLLFQYHKDVERWT